MRNSDETQQITNMDELINGIQILFKIEALTSLARKSAASLVSELAEFKGERGLHILRALARGEMAPDDARKLIYARCYSPAHINNTAPSDSRPTRTGPPLRFII
jgi:hypothetical protein